MWLPEDLIIRTTLNLGPSSSGALNKLSSAPASLVMDCLGRWETATNPPSRPVVVDLQDVDGPQKVGVQAAEVFGKALRMAGAKTPVHHNDFGCIDRQGEQILSGFSQGGDLG